MSEAQTAEATPKLTRKDFSSDQEVRWCPGCGDYAILATMQKTLPELGVKKENIVFVSGIGCSSRFPYYMNTFGLHTIHGRAPAFATGIKITNPQLDVWMITGDGDGLSIGGNHLLHVLRRNVDMQILLFNNRIYGLTKGQYSPTSLIGHTSPSTPMGSVDAPIIPAAFALGAGARFVARAPDTNGKMLSPVFKRAHQHKGSSFVEILQNCPVFNDGAWDFVNSKQGATSDQLWLEHGKPMTFGEGKGLRVKPGSVTIEVVTVGEEGVTEDDLLVHNETDRTMAFLLANMMPADGFPVAMGVLLCAPAASFEALVAAQQVKAKETRGNGDLQALLGSGHTWTID